MNLLRLPLLVDDAGHNNDASSCLFGWRFGVGSRDQSGRGDGAAYVIGLRRLSAGRALKVGRAASDTCHFVVVRNLKD
jgi:hypothetical protein